MLSALTLVGMRREWWAPLTGVAFVVVAIVGAIIGGEPPDADSPVQEIIDHYTDNKTSIEVALQALWDNDFIPLALGTEVFLISTGLSIVRHAALPKWLGWVALVLAVVGFTPIGFVAFGGAGLWIAVVSVMLAVRARPAPE